MVMGAGAGTPLQLPNRLEALGVLAASVQVLDREQGRRGDQLVTFEDQRHRINSELSREPRLVYPGGEPS